MSEESKNRDPKPFDAARGKPFDAAQGKGRLRWRLITGCIVAAVAGLALSTWPAIFPVGPRSHWLLQAMASRLFATCAVVLVVGGVLFVLIGSFLWQAGRPYRTAGRGQQGVAILEFALALPFLLILGLVMAQASLLMVGNVCVHYAAFCSNRAAIVFIPQEFGGTEPQNLLDASGADVDSSKMYRIKLAAVTALAPVSCGSEDVDPAGPGGDAYVTGVSSFLSLQSIDRPGWVDKRLSRKLAYAQQYTEVTVDPPQPKTDPAKMNKDGYFDDNEDVHVSLKHTFYMGIPTGARIFSLFPGGVELPFGSNEYGMEISARYTLPNEGVQDYVDVEVFPRDAN